jgi:chemotaxis protein histidine kinase CheA
MIKNQIVALGGEISVISKQDIGSTFTVTFS